MKNWKKNMMAAAILLVVCVGIYTNWMYSNTQAAGNLTDYLDSDKVLSDNGIVMGAQAVLGDENDTVSDYFAAVRLSRQEARDSALSLLSDAADQESGSAEELTREVSAIAQSALQEVRIESLVKAKGFTDCVAFISEDQISLVVAAPASGLNQTDVAKIRDIVQSETEFSAEQIRIVEVSEPAA